MTGSPALGARKVALIAASTSLPTLAAARISSRSSPRRTTTSRSRAGLGGVGALSGRGRRRQRDVFRHHPHFDGGEGRIGVADARRGIGQARSADVERRRGWCASAGVAAAAAAAPSRRAIWAFLTVSATCGAHFVQREGSALAFSRRTGVKIAVGEADFGIVLRGSGIGRIGRRVAGIGQQLERIEFGNVGAKPVSESVRVVETRVKARLRITSLSPTLIAVGVLKVCLAATMSTALTMRSPLSGLTPAPSACSLRASRARASALRRNWLRGRRRRKSRRPAARRRSGRSIRFRRASAARRGVAYPLRRAVALGVDRRLRANGSEERQRLGRRRRSDGAEVNGTHLGIGLQRNQPQEIALNRGPVSPTGRRRRELADRQRKNGPNAARVAGGRRSAGRRANAGFSWLLKKIGRFFEKRA